jgi:serine/threonine protein phosphatase 1
MALNPSPMTYAVGDIHGEVSLLRQLMGLLPLTPADTVVFLGDYMDRGEDSLATVRYLIALGHTLPHAVFLRGNHEEAWLEHWDGTRFTAPSDLDGALDVWDDANGNVPAEIGQFLAETRIDYEDEHGIYVHAGLRPHLAPDRASHMVKLWGAFDFLHSQYDWGKPVVFGHWQQQQPLTQPNKIGIDTGAYRSGVLTAVRLPDRQLFQTHW